MRWEWEGCEGKWWDGRRYGRKGRDEVKGACQVKRRDKLQKILNLGKQVEARQGAHSRDQGNLLG